MNKKDAPVDHYTKLKNQLTRLILKKKDLDAQLAALEESIYDKEVDYFNESTYGNIVKGFDNFAKSSAGGSNKRKMNYTDDDHIFSMSSATFVRTLMKRQGVAPSTPDYDDFEDAVETGSPQAIKDANGSTPKKKKT